ncbi:uncharacterized protein LOC106459540 isoform X2 [Limulus polyphemus]|uniref:Uncharacterized protein LOC106459540 isoform X2 n=1 Tax=Limulus polyphemus TaxID=6850 RepID=A0ABM1B4G2_LIMPO|nr:uncharacterized protein LOC106459540 isoform X2 [Limulus polyphemus]
MSGRMKQRRALNPVDLATLSVNERILRECHNLYVDPENGLVKVASNVGLNLLAPRKKIIVMLIGNHSAGKSTFINWYIEEHVQKTGVAIETQGFTIVTSGRKRESLTGNATLHLFPYLKPLQVISEVVDYLGTEVSTSKQKKFSLVTFIDTPGLVDGEMVYPFDVDKAILWLGDIADLTFVFFDPIGQALCKRTIDLVEKLNTRHGDRLRFYLSKADEAGDESDRQKVMMQIVQELCKRPGLNKCGFDMPTIYIPLSNKYVRCINQIDEVCKDIEKTINQTIQNMLNTLEKDCEHVAELINARIEEDNEAKTYNFHARSRVILLGLAGLFLPFLLFLNFMVSSFSKEFFHSFLGQNGTESLYTCLSPVRGFWQVIPNDYHFTALGIILVVSIMFLLLARWFTRLKPTMNRKERRNLLEKRDYVQNTVKVKKHHLYQEYLEQSITEQDL